MTGTGVFIALVILGMIALISLSIIAARRESAEIFAKIKELLEANPTDPAAHKEAMELYSKMECRRLYAQPFYKLALDIVEQHPDNTRCRVFTLEVGRMARSMQRLDGLTTIYDEQAIQNDILTRAKDIVFHK